MLDEINQTHATRRPFIEALQKTLKRNVITFFTSRVYPVMIMDEDNDMIEGVLRTLDQERGLTLVLNSPGGSALAAERIVNSCRTFSNGDFEVMVPRFAKSAATMICMGANSVKMSKTSELGPIDPQVVIMTHEGTQELRGAFYLIESYKDLFKRAEQTKGRIEPYLQQLDRYDARDIRMYEEMMSLGEDIAIKLLRSSMMRGKKPAIVKRKVAPFLDPRRSKTHGRPIYAGEARKAGLVVEDIDIRSDQWQSLWQLYVRSNQFVNSDNSKLVESLNDSFFVSAPRSKG